MVERGQPGRGATWAAAGVVAPHHLGAGPGPLFELLRRSRAAYPAFLARLGQASTDWRGAGGIVVARDAAEADELHDRAAWLSAAGYAAVRLTPTALRELEPSCTGDLAAAVFFPGDACLDPRRLGAALTQAARAAGVELLTGRAADHILVRASTAVGVRAGDRELSADSVVLTAGAWSPPLAPGFRLPVRPSKGQMCAVLADGPRRAITFPDGVIAPRADGRAALGGTREDVGFAAGTDSPAIAQLHANAAAIVPSLANAEIVETWAGFRPRSADGFPIIGASPVDRLVVATGHDTKGIALAPVTAESVAQIVCDGGSDPLLRPFAPSRFA